jgi:hypothetical protein
MTNLRCESGGRRVRSVVGWCLLTALAVVGAAGCGPRTKAELYQPRQDGRQQLLELESRWANFAADDAAADRWLLAWPLPGSIIGQKQYLLYMRLPRGGGEFGFGPDAGGANQAVGFFIQRAGRLAGLTPIVRGQINASSGKKLRKGTLQLKCGDGTEIKGTFRAERADFTVGFFEDDHRSDVAALIQPAP